jgi:2-phosphosulfolactate phosphatase
MEIRIESLMEGARRAQGTVVIIDVFRAFTTAAVALAQGADRIIMVAEPDDALRLRDKGVGEVCVGEVDGKRPEGFDFGNSPYELARADLRSKAIIQSTRAGTVGVEAATGATAIYAGSLVTAKATAKAILDESPPLVTIVAMGYNALTRTDEDELCALYLRNLLEGRQQDTQAIRTLVRQSGEMARFARPDPPHGYPQDVDMALKIDKYDFAVRIRREDDLLVARRHA